MVHIHAVQSACESGSKTIRLPTCHERTQRVVMSRRTVPHGDAANNQRRADSIDAFRGYLNQCIRRPQAFGKHSTGNSPGIPLRVRKTHAT